MVIIIVVMDQEVYQEILLMVLSVEKYLPQALRIFATCLLVNDSSCRQLILSSESPILFDDNLKTTSVSFFIADFHLLSCESDSFTFELLY